MTLALAALLAAWPPMLSPPPAPAPTPAAAPEPAPFYYPPEELRRVLPRDAVTRVGLMADLSPFESAAAGAFTAAARAEGLQVVPLLVRRGPLERTAPALAEGYRLDAVATLQVGQLGGERVAIVEVWSKSGAKLGTVTTRRPPTPQERAAAEADAQYERQRLGVEGAQQFQGDGKRLSRSEFYALVGRNDLAQKEDGLAVARGVLIGGGLAVGGVGLVLELAQLLVTAVILPFDVAACELHNDLSGRSYGPGERPTCSGPDQSPIPFVMILGGGVLAATGAAIPGDAASPEQREELARAYNLRLREQIGHPKQARAPVTLGVSAGAVPGGGMVVLGGRF